MRAPLALASRGLDRAEDSLRGLARVLSRPRAFHAAAVLLVMLAVAVRLPLVVAADDVPNGHNDANVHFNWVYTIYLDEGLVPDAHRGSGWHLLLYLTLSAFGVEAGEWVHKGADLPPPAAHAALLAYALSAMLSAGAVAATFLLARLVLPPVATLGAMLLVAFDPYLLGIATSSMSEPPYTVLLVLALACVLKARDHPAWLLGAGALMALAHVMRINGLVMLGTVLLFAWLLLRRVPVRRRAAWAGAALVVFLVVAAPYLAWRAYYLPGPFDYGTNQRFWADDLWDMDDAYWTSYTVEEGGPRETMADYFAQHDLADAAGRLWTSVQWQVFDLVGVGQWPPLETQGGHWPGSPPEGAALTPLVAGLSLVAAFALRGRRDLWFLPLAVLVTFATFVWIYPLVRSVRYFSPLLPLFAVYAMAGWLFLAAFVRRPHLVGALVLAAWTLLYGARVLLHVPAAAWQVMGTPDVRALVGLLTLLWTALVLAPLAKPAVAKLARAVLRRRSGEALPP